MLRPRAHIYPLAEGFVKAKSQEIKEEETQEIKT